MARTKAISLIQSGSTKADLAELSGLVIANIQKDTLAQGLKSQAYTGNPASGSVEFKRFKNSASQPYGTARTANKGTAITVPPTPVNLDTHREIVEEAAKFDLDTFGVTNIMARRADNHVDTVAAEFDAAFFQTAFDAGTAYTPDASATIEEILEGLIQSVETVKNDYVRGVPRNLIRLVLDPVTYGKARNYLDKNTNNANVDTAAEDFAMFHGVRVYSSINLPVKTETVESTKTKTTTCHGVAMIEGAIAQPAVSPASPATSSAEARTRVGSRWVPIDGHRRDTHSTVAPGRAPKRCQDVTQAATSSGLARASACVGGCSVQSRSPSAPPASQSGYRRRHCLRAKATKSSTLLTPASPALPPPPAWTPAGRGRSAVPAAWIPVPAGW